MARLTFNGENFIFACTFEERILAKEAGFRWNNDFKEWYSPLHGTAARLRKYADATALSEMDRVVLRHTPWTGRIPYPKRFTPKPFQLQCAKAALETNRYYLGMDPRLGKTPTAAMILNAEGSNAIYICPPFLVASTREKLQDWTMGLTVSKFTFPAEQSLPNVLLVPDNMLLRKTTIEAIRVFVKSCAWNNRPVRLFIDEAHRFKEPTAKRTKALYDQVIPLFDKVTWLSGSPRPNRNMELYHVLSRAAPETIDHMNRFEFGRRYCAGYRGEWGWNFDGSSNTQELIDRICPKFMLRIKKEDVVKDLPPVIEEMILIDDDLPPQAARLDKELLKTFSPDDLMTHLAPNGHVATYRKELGKAKVEESLKVIKSIMEDTEEKILVFGIHKEVMDDLYWALTEYHAVKITGDTPMAQRQGIVNQFQNDPVCRIFLGNIQAAGIGLDLWKADRVVFVEWSWVPGENEQALMRSYKMGKTDNIFAQYMVYKNSLDRVVMDAIFKKKKDAKYV